ncbi:MAG: glucosamine-6-phosphate deaminase [Bacteroidia bacterium 44-10]|nr:MAG: glucosamine-6-phosphate deaminase [Bacteroidia bacterium 44-10]
MTDLIKEFKVDALRVFVYESRAAMGVSAYELYKQKVQQMIAGRKENIRAVYAAAHSQNDFLRALAKDNEIDFSRIDAFHMDEYMGLGDDAPQNFGSFLKNSIFSRQKFNTVNYVNSSAKDINAECKRYEKLLREAPLDIVSLGIGENGHIAFNDPHEARFYEPQWVKETSLDVVCRQQQVNDREFSHIDEVPKTALTLTIPALMSCKTVIGIVPDVRKAKAVYETLNGPISEACPASILRIHNDATLFIDKDAATLLQI